MVAERRELHTLQRIDRRLPRSGDLLRFVRIEMGPWDEMPRANEDVTVVCGDVRRDGRVVGLEWIGNPTLADEGMRRRVRVRFAPEEERGDDGQIGMGL